jgi:cytoskeleton protein RodZ
VASFGTRLKEERERRKISLDEISATTKISTRLLHALEEDHFDLLPGGIFNKGFIRAYAQYLGLDEEQIIAEYVESTQVQPAGGEPNKSVPLTTEIRAAAETRDPGTVSWGLFAALLLISALGVAVWGYRSRQATTADKAPAPYSNADTASMRPGAASPSGDSAQPAVKAISTKSNEGVPKVANATSAASPATSSILVHIRAHEDSWVSITTDGKRIFQDTLVASSEKSVQASKEMTLRAGNMAGLDLEWNGQRLPPQGSDGEAMTLRFDANGWHVVPKPTPAADSPNPI